MHYRMFNNIPGFYPLHTTGNPALDVTTKKAPFSEGRRREKGANSPLIENQWPSPLEKSSYQLPCSLEHSYNSSITRKVSHGRGNLTPVARGGRF